MKIVRVLSLALGGVVLALLASCAPPTTGLTFGSWRTDDVAKWTAIIAEFNKTNPNIKIKFDPTTPADYNATLRLQLDNGNGPDLFYARSFAVGKDLFKSGYELDLSAEPFVTKGYTPSSNRGVLGRRQGFRPAHRRCQPRHLLQQGSVRQIRHRGSQDLARADCRRRQTQEGRHHSLRQRSGRNWDILEVVLMNILPSTVGGAEGRQAYESGARKLNDASIVAAFQQLKDLAPYLPKGFEAVSDNDATSLFEIGKVAMVFWGSWDIPAFSDKIKDFQWSVFATPPLAGKPNVIEFMPDFGVAINPKSKNVEAAKTFLAWLAGPDGGKAIGENLIGFFPMSNAAVDLSNPYANTFLAFNKGTTQDFRFTWDKLSDNKLPSYNLLLTESGRRLEGDPYSPAGRRRFCRRDGRRRIQALMILVYR